MYIILLNTNQLAISMKIKKLEKSGVRAVKMLRESKLKRGLPFMINSRKLPTDQCYLEYPDGSMVLVILSRKNSDFKVISEFSLEEGSLIRKQNNLL